jgi:hypothetical protein
LVKIPFQNSYIARLLKIYKNIGILLLEICHLATLEESATIGALKLEDVCARSGVASNDNLNNN